MSFYCELCDVIGKYFSTYLKYGLTFILARMNYDCNVYLVCMSHRVLFFLFPVVMLFKRFF